MTRSDVIRLGSYPTPVSRARFGDVVELWVKRDDQTSSIYGGNKVRKLEHLLGEARTSGKSKLLTMGAAGSHQVLATALYGKREGFTVDAVLVGQPASDSARNNLRASIALGMTPTIATSWPAAPAKVAMHMARHGSETYFIPLGGSNALGSLGFVDAAKELAAQVSAGLLPEPDHVVVAMGSGGTAAGLAVGFEVLDMKTRVVGVVVSPPAPVLTVMARHVTKKTAALVGLSRHAASSAAARIEVDRRWVGRGYGYSTREGDDAIRLAKESEEHLLLDTTYTSKAFACALAFARERPPNEVIVYWHTLSSAPLDAFLQDAPSLPADLEQLFKKIR